MSAPRGQLRYYGAIWGVAGIIALLCFAIYRLVPYATEALRSDLSILQWIILCAWCIFMIASEGRDGFERRIAPRIAARAEQIKTNGDNLSIILAPLYCFGYFRAPLRQMIVSYVAIAAIIIAVIAVHQFSQPWRGIVDCGVVLGLAYGVVAILARCISAGIHQQTVLTHKSQ